MEELQTKNAELEQDVAKMTIAIGNEHIRNDMQLGDLKTKIKLLQDALTKRNSDIELAEENNAQLLQLLEKYDTKLDDM